MILTKHLAHDTRGLAVGLIGPHARVVHGVENAALDRLETVAGIGQCREMITLMA